MRAREPPFFPLLLLHPCCICTESSFIHQLTTSKTRRRDLSGAHFHRL